MSDPLAPRPRNVPFPNSVTEYILMDDTRAKTLNYRLARGLLPSEMPVSGDDLTFFKQGVDPEDLPRKKYVDYRKAPSVNTYPSSQTSEE